MLVPEGVSLEDAGAIPVTYLTAWHMLAHLGNLREGETVLIHGIAGGVGTAAMQIAKLFKAGVVYGTASPSKVDGVNERGGVLINRDNFAAELMRETKGRGVDHILDPVGGSVLRQSYKCLAPGGRLYTFGLSAAAPGRRLNPFAALKAVFAMRGFNLSQMMMDNRGVFGVHMGTFSDFDLLRGHLSQIIEHVVCGDFEPVIDSVFPLAESTQAHEHIHARRNVGKVLLDLQ
jgi:NADPH:quinone reductase-like Zn-dependent oxidoreductase